MYNTNRAEAGRSFPALKDSTFENTAENCGKAPRGFKRQTSRNCVALQVR